MQVLCRRTDDVGRSTVSELCCRILCAEISKGRIAVESRAALISGVCRKKTCAGACRREQIAWRKVADGGDRVVEGGRAGWKGGGLQANGRGSRCAREAGQMGC